MEGCPKSPEPPEPEFVDLGFIYNECVNKLNELYNQYCLKNSYHKSVNSPAKKKEAIIDSCIDILDALQQKIINNYERLRILVKNTPSTDTRANSDTLSKLNKYKAYYTKIFTQFDNDNKEILYSLVNDIPCIITALAELNSLTKSVENIKAKLESGIKYQINEDKNLEIRLQLDDNEEEVITLNLNNLKQKFEDILQIYNADNNKAHNQNTFGKIISTKQQILEIIGTIQSNLKNLNTENSGISNQIKELRSKISLLEEFCTEKNSNLLNVLQNPLQQYLEALEAFKTNDEDMDIFKYNTSTTPSIMICSAIIEEILKIEIGKNKAVPNDIQNNINLIKQAVKFIDSLNKGEVTDISPLVEAFMGSTAIDLLD